MQNRDFLQRYRLSLGRKGRPVELHRTPSGSTYRGHEIATGREVAIELIPWSSSDPAATAQVEARAAAAQQLDHPNFPKLHAFGIEEGQLVYVTDYFEGYSAEAWVAGRGPLPLGAVLRVAVQVVSALGAANFHRLHHRAVNPANIIFVPGETAEGEWPAIKLLQRFGPPQEVFAAAGDDAQADVAAAFASPEQRRGGEVDFASAVFSLGCTIWFLLTGAPPTTPGAEPVRAKVATLRGVPKIVRHLLGRMLSGEPAERPRDPVALQTYLQTCLARAERSQAMRRRWGVIPAARPRAVVARTQREWPVKSLALAALILLCAALAAVAIPRFLRTRNPTGAPLSAAAARSALPPNLVKEPSSPEEGPAAQPPIAALTHDEEPALADKPIGAEAPPAIAVAPPTAVAAADEVEEAAPNEPVAPEGAALAIVASPSPTESLTAVAAADQVEEFAPNEPTTPVETTSGIVEASPSPTASPTAVAAADQVEESAPNEQATPVEAASAIVAASPSPLGSPTAVAAAPRVKDSAPHELATPVEAASAIVAASPSPTASPMAVAADDQVEKSAPNEPATPGETASAIVAASPNPTASPTVVAVVENVAPAPHEPIRQPAIPDAQVAEPSPAEPPAPAEASTEIVAAAPAPTPEQTAAALAKVDGPVPNESSAPAASATPEPAVVLARVTTHKKSTSHRAAKVAKASRPHARSSRPKTARAEVRRGRQIPKLRVGSHSAELVGTTSDGRWILSVASSGERVIVPPPPGYSP